MQQLRARVLAAGEDQATLEAEWLWTFLRPLTDLLEHVGGARALRQLQLGVDNDDAVPFTPYLRLARKELTCQAELQRVAYGPAGRSAA